MAVITAALLEALRTDLRRQFNDAYKAMQPETFWSSVATLVPSNSGSNTYGWLGDWPDLIEWVGDRTVKDLKESGYEIANKLYEATVGIPRTQLEDDNIGIYGPQAQSMGAAAARHPDKIISALLAGGDAALCFDGQNFFDTDHPVYPNHDGTGAPATVSNLTAGASDAWYLLDCSKPLKPLIFQERTKPEFDSLTNASTTDSVFTTDKYQYGIRYRCNGGYGFWQLAHKATVALDEANFDTVYAGMMSLKADGDRPMGIMPTHLIVPPSLRASANAVIERMLGDGGASNPNYKAVTVKVVPWLA